MKIRWLLLLCLISIPTFAQTGLSNPKSCFRGPFESHSKWLSFLSSSKKNFNEERFLKSFPKSKYDERKATLDCVDFTYEVDGFTVEGFYIKPKTESEENLPVVIYNRGGNAQLGYVVFGRKMNFIADLAARGFIVVGSQYRGSSSRLIKNNGHDEFGGRDVNDVLALLPLLKDIPNADASNVAMLGWSRGAMQSYLAAKHMPEVKTIVSIAGNADVASALKWRPAMEKVYKARVPDFELNRENELRKRSVIHWIDELPKAPILLIHGTNDKRVNAEQSKLLASALDKQEHPNKLLIYEGDNHGLVRNRKDMVDEIDSWLKEYL